MFRTLVDGLRCSRTNLHVREGPAGQGLVEYALILVLVVLVILVVVTLIGPWVGNVYSNIIFNI